MLLDPLAPSARAARRFVRSELVRLGRQELTEAAELGVSELTANATLHARTPFRVSVSVTGSGAVRIGVADSSRVLPDRRRHSELAGTGRGLRLLSVAGRWGVEPSTDGTGKTVWFEPHERLDEAAFSEGLDQSGLAL
jgi:hypothetical protein